MGKWSDMLFGEAAQPRIRDEPAYRPPVRIGTTIPPEWADVLEELEHTPIDEHNGPPKKSDMIRNALRLYLQHKVKSVEVWDRCELGPIPEKPEYPEAEVIDLAAEDYWEVDERGARIA